MRVARSFRPDVVYFWSQSELCYWFVGAARRERYPVAFFLSDTNFVSWRVGAWLGGLARRNSLIRGIFGKTFLVQGQPIIRHQSCHFASRFLRQVAERNDIPVDESHSIVAHWGIDPLQFGGSSRLRWPIRRLLYAGQLIPQKGVHTAIAALGMLVQGPNGLDLTLTVAGGGLDLQYQQSLRDLASRLGISDRVSFAGQIPRAELVETYAAHDVLVFPSEWDEPFAITPLEAMAAGLAIVGTITGGSGELLRNRETALTFVTGDGADCARAVSELCGDQQLYDEVRLNGEREVKNKHTLGAMVATVEAELMSIVGHKPVVAHAL